MVYPFESTIDTVNSKVGCVRSPQGTLLGPSNISEKLSALFLVSVLPSNRRRLTMTLAANADPSLDSLSLTRAPSQYSIHITHQPTPTCILNSHPATITAWSFYHSLSSLRSYIHSLYISFLEFQLSTPHNTDWTKLS